MLLLHSSATLILLGWLAGWLARVTLKNNVPSFPAGMSFAEREKFTWKRNDTDNFEEKIESGASGLLGLS